MGKVLQLLGIQATPSNVDQFLIALYTGLSAAILAGVFVGLVVWYFQSRYEKRRLRQQYERDFSILEEKICTALDDPHETDITSIRTLPQPARTIAEVSSEFPLDQLKKYLPKKRKIFDLLKEFQQTRSEFASTAMKLQQPIRTYIRQFNYKLPLTEDVKFESFYLARMLGFQNKSIMDWTGITPDMLSELEKLLEFILEDNEIVQFNLEYLQARGELELTVDKIRSAFGYETVQLPESPFKIMPRVTYLTNSAVK